MRLYRALLHLYPSSFRHEYGRDMSADFRARRQRTSGAPGVAALWTGTIADVIGNAARAHLDILSQDLRYALRSLRRSAGFTFTVVMISALGIGATSAAFSIADHVLIRPLPFASPDRLVDLWQSDPAGSFTNEASPGNYRDWKNRSTTFESIAAFHNLSVNLAGDGEPERLEGAAVTSDLLPLLGVRPEIGRLFADADGREGAPLTVLLSDGFWTTRYGRDHAILGKIVRLDDRAYEVIGVMPPAFRFPNRNAEVWTPVQFAPGDFTDRTDTFLRVVGRLKRGVSVAQGQAEMKTIAADLERAFPADNAKVSIQAVPMRDELSNQTRLLLNVLVAASIALLLIACANLSNILLVRGLTRRRELALRAALGAGRERLVRQMITESALLSLAGGLLGVLLAVSVVPFVARLVPTSLPIADAPAVDTRMLLVAAFVTLATGFGFGMLPIMRVRRGHATRLDLNEGARIGAGKSTDRMRSVLVVAAVAMSVTLLVSAGLLVRALWRVQGVEPGFSSANVMTMRTTLPMPKYGETAPRSAFYRRVLDDVRAMPGVTNAAYISFLPMVMRGGIWKVTVPGELHVPGEEPSVSLRFITPGFFATLGIPLRRGRDVTDTDNEKAEWVAVVSESFGRRHWPGQDPLGRHFTLAAKDRVIVGVVGDIRVRGLERTSEPQVYLPEAQNTNVSTFYAPKDLVVKTSGPVDAILPAIRRSVAKADPVQPISDVRALDEIVAGETAARSVQLRVLGGFAVIACLLAAFGIHGLLSFAVSTQTREIGVRMALGAQRTDVVGFVVRKAALLAAMGLLAGVVLAGMAGRGLESGLAGLQWSDKPTFAVATALVLIMTMAGSLGSALRALRIDPMQAMRHD